MNIDYYRSKPFASSVCAFCHMPLRVLPSRFGRPNRVCQSGLHEHGFEILGVDRTRLIILRWVEDSKDYTMHYTLDELYHDDIRLFVNGQDAGFIMKGEIDAFPISCFSIAEIEKLKLL